MAVDCRCPECQDNLGKDVENHIVAFCGNCGHSFYNERGYGEPETEKEKKIVAEAKAEIKKYRRSFM